MPDPNMLIWSYPGQEDVDFARKYDATYGYDAAPYLLPSTKINQLTNTKQIHDLFDLRKSAKVNPQDIGVEPAVASDQSVTDQRYAAWLAAQRSPTAALGFDPRRTYVSPFGSIGDEDYIRSGFHLPNSGASWYDMRYPSAQVHESMHRGINKMRGIDTTLQPTTWNLIDDANEEIVRGLMHRNYGDVELSEYRPNDEIGIQQANDAKRTAPGISGLIDMIEEMAARISHARGRPMGPR